MNATLQHILTAVLSGSIAAFFTAVLFRGRIRQELMVEYDKDLRKARIEAYGKLYSYFPVIARYSREKELTYEDLRHLAAQMRDWYFGVGGLYLSEQSRPVYFGFKKQLDATVTSASAVTWSSSLTQTSLRRS